jgi:hypothetical protein
MTVAAQEASVLRDLARRFFNAVQPAIDIPWDIAVGNDLRHPQVVGPRSAKVKFINWYVGKLHKAARHDAWLTAAFVQVANLKAPPERLLHPAVVARVISGNLRRGEGDAAAARVGLISRADRSGRISTRSASHPSASSPPGNP